MNNEVKKSIIDIIRSCDYLIFASNGLGGYPDARNFINIFNRDIDTLDLYFFTSTRWHTLGQIMRNPNVCLYYFNPETRMSVRLFGTVTLVQDMAAKRARWDDNIKKFNVTGPDDPTYCFLHFTPKRYKFYIGYEEHKGEIDGI
ncbi:MAG: pyridoxamine 5'-phosphate oxidase family protein [Alphaproteobacteria bacterium]|nr:pyridoxamine 5'-phosphate oxidase family protein [Alphaproteobacteria bacterium]MCL2889681.1 pyridoxamine 5'-phosphate oxidase family protein [Alphaproteobacteria bacterium]